jgi:hypothetical protein
VHYLSCRTFPFTAITAMSTLAKRSKNWSANDTAELSSESETGREQDHEPQFGSVHDAQLKLKHQAKSFDAKIDKMKVRFNLSWFSQTLPHGGSLQNKRPFFAKARFLFPFGILGVLFYALTTPPVL